MTGSGSLVPAASSSEGERGKGAADGFSRKTRREQKSLRHPKRGISLNKDGHWSHASAETKMPAPLSHVYGSRLRSETRLLQVTKPLMAVETQLWKRRQDCKTVTRPQRRRRWLLHPWVYWYSSWRRMRWSRRRRRSCCPSTLLQIKVSSSQRFCS